MGITEAMDSRTVAFSHYLSRTLSQSLSSFPIFLCVSLQFSLFLSHSIFPLSLSLSLNPFSLSFSSSHSLSNKVSVANQKLLIQLHRINCQQFSLGLKINASREKTNGKRFLFGNKKNARRLPLSEEVRMLSSGRAEASV